MHQFTYTALAAFLACLLRGGGIAAAQGSEAGDPTGEGEPASEIIVIDGDASSPREQRADRARSEAELVTRIDVAESSPADTLADVVGHSVGAEVRSVGGLGGFSSVSVRGLSAGHTPVLLDGVPLSRIATVTADLSRLDLASFSSVELYRGAVPSSLGAGGLGGALNLISAVGEEGAGPRGALSVGLGSFGARHLRGHYLGSDGALGYQLGLGYAGADGDYLFFNDNGTNLNTDDDTFEQRTNNGFDQATAVLRAREERGESVVVGGARFFGKRQGLPGIGSRQTDRARLESATGVLDTTVEQRHRGIGLRGQGFAMFDRQRVIDEGSEVGIGAGDSVGDTVSAGLGGAIEGRVGGRLERLALVVDTRGDWFRQRGSSAQDGMRGQVSGALEARVALGERAALLPQLRVGVTRTTANGTSPGGQPMAAAGRTDLDVNPRLAAIAMATPTVSLKASGGYAVRQPTLVEMFGDRGYLAGNPDIRAERGVSADAGIVVAPLPTAHFSDALFELAAFIARPTDAIVYAPSAAGIARPFNVDGARLLGAELSATALLGKLVRVTGNYTFLSAVQRSSSESLDGKALPNRSRHQGYGRVALECARFSLWTDVALSSGNFVDQANIILLPARAFVGGGFDVALTRRLTITATGKNLTDNTVETIELLPPPRPDLTEIPRPVSDFFGYPLPGRAFYLSLAAQL